MEAGIAEWNASCCSVRIYSRLLDVELWIAPDEKAAEALERDLAA
jgi:hypothetical protein